MVSCLCIHPTPSADVSSLYCQQVLGRHYILEAYQELPKVLASLDIFGNSARLLLDSRC
jgi:hypothetical protein